MSNRKEVQTYTEFIPETRQFIQFNGHYQILIPFRSKEIIRIEQIIKRYSTMPINYNANVDPTINDAMFLLGSLAKSCYILSKNSEIKNFVEDQALLT